MKYPQSQMLKAISWSDTYQNLEYQQLVRNLFEQEWILKIQKNFLHKRYPSRYAPAPVSVRPLKEPIGLNYLEIAEHINAGNWLKLNFKDKDFSRDIFKALRTKLITTEQMATAKILYDAAKMYSTKILQHTFDELGDLPGIWSANNIAYATPYYLKQFKKELAGINANQAYAFTVQFSPRMEKAFFYDWLSRLRADTPDFIHKQFKESFYDFCNRRINAAYLAQDVDDFLFDEVVEPNSLEEFKGIFFARFRAFFKHPTAPDWRFLVKAIAGNQVDLTWLSHRIQKNKATNLRDPVRESSIVMMAFFDVFVEQGFSVVKTPATNNTPSTGISILLPSVAVLKAFLKSFYGSHASLPFFTLGNITPRMIRLCDDRDQSRPVLLSHPDIKHQAILEDAYSLDFAITWHDGYFHCLRNSIQQNKLLYRYIKNLLTRLTGFDMSKLIWKLSDLDLTQGEYAHLRTIEASPNRAFLFHEHLHAFKYSMEKVAPLWAEPSNELATILIIDMQTNPRKWGRLVGQDIKSYLRTLKSHLAGSVADYDDRPINERFSLVSRAMATLKTTNTMAIMIYLYLSKHYKSYDHSQVLALCLTLINDNLLNDVFLWTKNDGLHFRSEAIDSIHTQVASYSARELLGQIHKAIITIQEEANANPSPLNLSRFGLFANIKPSAPKPPQHRQMHYLELPGSVNL